MFEELEGQMNDAWTSSGWRAAGQQGGGGVPTPSTVSTQAASELGTGAILLMLGIWALAEYGGKKLR